MSSYDQNLLDEVPRATRAQLQEGYNVDLLEQPPRRTPSTRIPPPPTPQPAPATVPLMSGVAESGSGEKLGSSSRASAAPKPRTSFWRSRNGVIAVVVIVLIVIGAVVGGAVGGTVKKSNNDTVGASATTPASSPSPLPSLVTPVANSTTSTTPTTVASQGIGDGVSRPAGFTAATGPTAAATTPSGQNVGG